MDRCKYCGESPESNQCTQNGEHIKEPCDAKKRTGPVYEGKPKIPKNKRRNKFEREAEGSGFF